MICLRCGYCCIKLFVPIVKNPDKGIKKDNIIGHYGNDSPCMHLKGDKPGKYKCSIHHYSWYKDTPCFRHEPAYSRKTSECLMGNYVLKKENRNAR